MSWLSDLFDDSDSSSGPIASTQPQQSTGATIFKSLAPAVTAGITSASTQRANTRAAQMVADSNDRATQAIQTGNNAAIKTLGTNAAAGAPGVSYLQGVVGGAQPGQLQPWQATQVDRQREQAARDLSAKMGGRSAVAIGNNLAQQGTERFLTANQGRTDQAAGTLAGIGTGANNSIANIESGGGAAAGRLIADSGVAAANATTANANVAGTSTGNILSSVLARDDKARGSRYGNFGGATNGGAGGSPSFDR